MVVFCVLGLSSCDKECDHEWSEWTTTKNSTCTEKGIKERTCSECEEKETSEIDALGHDWNEATCSAPKTCKNCSATEGEKLSHSYTEQAVKAEALKSPATCESAAVYYKSCSCGAIGESDADTFTSGEPLGHKDENNDHACDYGCDKTFGAHEDSATDADHVCDYGCGAVLNDCADAEGDGDHACDVCGKAGVSSHTYGQATCEIPSTCSECGATEGETLPHVYSQEVVKDKALKSPATCESAAVYYKSCSCGAVSASDTDTFTFGNAIPHTYSEKVVSSDTLKSPATCENAAVYYKSCSCGAVSASDADTFSYGDAADHTYDSEVVTADALKSEATCKSAAVYYKSCSCGAISENDADTFTSGSVKPHNYKLVSSTEATCESAATETYECECGDKYTDTIGDALGHDINGVTPIEVNVSGCEYVLTYVCKRDGCKTVVQGDHIYKHTYVASITEAATCNEDGIKTLKCSCGAEKTETIPKDATGHNWQKGEVENGVRTDVCSYCEAEKSVAVYEGTTTDNVNAGDLADTEIELNDANISLDSGVIDTIGDQQVTVSADKLEGNDRTGLGLSDDQLAQVGDSPIYNFTINNGSENISEFGEENYVTITLPYTLIEGEDVDSIAIWFITDEGELESIKATYNNGYVTFKTNHFSYYTVTRLTPKERCALYGHSYTHQHVEGNCLKDEYDLYVCVRCHERYIDEDTLIVGDGHDYVEETVNATCTENGYVKYTCSDCGHTYSTKIGAIGHIFEVVESEEATCTLNGYDKFVCLNCGEEYTVTYAKLPHSYSAKIYEADCENAGYTLYTCDGCGYSYTGDYVSALGHSYDSVNWSWSVDNTVAVLTVVCKNNEDHIETLNAVIGTTVINGTCSSFVRTVYTAAVSFGGKTYTDEKIFEIGTPDHKFSEDWSTDGEEHWHECVCGERTDVSKHTFENAEVTSAPTCALDGESVAYCVCGEIETTVIPATGEHNYVGGFCTECGCEFVNTYYVNLINSWKDIDGFAIKIQNFSYELKGRDNSLLDSLKLIGSIKQVDIAELVLYVEDGELHGAATGTIVIFNGPFSNAEAICEFKAVIHEGYVYIEYGYGKETVDNTTAIKVSVDAAIDSIMEEIDFNGAAVSAIGSALEIVLPAIDTIIELNSEETDEILESLFNIIFTLEEQEDGSFVATLDYDKLHALNENLSTMTVSEIVDHYFGEGSFDSLVDFAIELLELKIPEIPAYLDELGLDSEEIMDQVNAIARDMGAFADFDIRDLINYEEYSDLTLGMIIFGVNDDSYLENLNGGVDYLRDSSLYEMIDPDSVEDIKESVDEVIDMIAEFLTVSFSTDNTGMLTSVSVGVNEFTTSAGSDREMFINFEIDLVINGRIDVTWDEIIEDIESKITIPAEELEDNVEAYYNYGYSGYLIYNGEEYYYEDGIRVYAYKYTYAEPTMVMIFADCDGWYEYELMYASEDYEFIIAPVQDGDTYRIFLIDKYNGRTVELVQTETGFTAIFEDGTTKDVVMDMTSLAESDYDSEIANMYADMYFQIFEDAEGEMDYFADSYSFYYNPETGEYSDESHHDYVREYEVLGDCCDEDGRVTRTTCTKCDYYDEYTNHWCETELVEIDLSERTECGGYISYWQCIYCETIRSYDSFDIHCSTEESESKEILDDEGNVVGYENTSVCKDCGLVITDRYWVDFAYGSECEYDECSYRCITLDGEVIFEYDRKNHRVEHEYEYEYELEGKDCYDGYTVYQHCTVCGKSSSWRSSGHRYEHRNVDLSEYGLCGGYIEEEYCPVCDTVMYSYIRDYNCSWDYVDTDEYGYSVYECERCGATKRALVSDGEKDENCNYTRNYIYVYIVDGKVVYEYEKNERFTNHSYHYEFLMNGTSCTDGYTLITTCDDCDMYMEEENKEHRELNLFILGDDLGCCDNHYLKVRGCPCGYYYFMDYDRENFIYDEALGQYVCESCGLTVVYRVNENENGCSLSEITEVEISLFGDTLYTFRKEQTYAYHSFGSLEMITDSGEVCLVTSCEKCGTVISTEMLMATTEYHKSADSDSDGETPSTERYYYDFVFTPDVTGVYTITGLSGRDTVLTLYLMNGDKLVRFGYSDDENGNQFLLTSTLNAGETYVYRIGFYGYDEEGEIPFTFNMGSSSTAQCRHNSEIEFSILQGASCEDGVLYGVICSECGVIRRAETIDWHRTVNRDYIDLSEYGACYGEFWVRSCACGYEQDVNIRSCYDEWTNNEYYDESGKLITVEVGSCNSCGLRYTNSYYTEKDRENCTLTYYYTVTLNIGSTLVLDKQYTMTASHHDYAVTGTLINGAGSSCEDGAIITYTCKDCGESYSNEVYHHARYEKEVVDLSKLGSVCGGYAVYTGCTCGYSNEMSISHTLCDFGSKWCELWIENAYTSAWYDAYVYTCAVTDPEQCAFKIRYASYVIKEEDSCIGYRYQTWQFGYNEDTGSYLYAITFKTGSWSTYHSYVYTDLQNGDFENGERYDCSVCGSYYYYLYNYDADGNCIREEYEKVNTLNDGNSKYEQRIHENAQNADGEWYTCRVYERTVYSDDSEYWYEELRDESAFSGPFGDPGREVSSSYSNSHGESYEEASAYVMYKGYSYYIYETRTESDEYWYRYDYTYNFDGVCTRTTSYTNSYGENWTEEGNCCHSSRWEIIKEPTCTQDGMEVWICGVCENIGESYTMHPYDHDWIELSESWYYCLTCGLENTNGVSGDIIMEDLTESYGNGEYYVVGYFTHSYVDFSQYVSLIFEDGYEEIVPDVEIFELDGIRAFAFSIAEVDAWAEANGFEGYNVRFAFVPYGSDGSLDYAITFTETIEHESIVGDASFADVVMPYEVKTYTIAPQEDAVWTITSQAEGDTRAILYDAEGNVIMENDDGDIDYNFSISYYLKAGETYTLEVRWYDESNYGVIPVIFDCGY